MELTVENCYDLKMACHKKKYQAAKFAKEVTNNSNGNRNGNRNDNGNGNEHLKQQVIRNQKLLMTSTEDDLKIITKASWWLSGWAFPLLDFGCPCRILGCYFFIIHLQIIVAYPMMLIWTCSLQTFASSIGHSFELITSISIKFGLVVCSLNYVRRLCLGFFIR